MSKHDRHKKDLRKLDKNSPEYWEEVLRREGMTMAAGHDPHVVSYVGNSNDVQVVHNKVLSGDEGPLETLITPSSTNLGENAVSLE